MTKEDYIRWVAPRTVLDSQERDLLPSFRIAQACFEPDFGNSELAVYAKNLFGVKNNDQWEGKCYRKGTKECYDGVTLQDVTADFRAYDSWEDSIIDQGDYLVNRCTTLKYHPELKHYAELIGNRDYRDCARILKEKNYGTAPDYDQRVIDYVERYDLTRFDTMTAEQARVMITGAEPEEKEELMDIKIVEKPATQNPCYRAGKRITPGGGMLHSVGCPQPDPLVFVKTWQNSSAKVCVHAVVGKEAVVYQLLPWNMRAWHCGSGPKGSGNDFLVSLEMTEPASIKYTGGSGWIETGNGANTKSHVLATYANAVQFFAHICKEYGFDPEDSNVLMSHHEGNAKGIASNHGDVEHIWSRFGLTMDQFRKDVKKAMGGGTVTTVPVVPADTGKDDTSSQKISPLDGTVTVIYTGADGLNIRQAPSITAKVDQIVHEGSFTVVGISSDEKWYKLKSGLFITTIPDYVKFKATPAQKESTAGTGYYRVRRSWDDAASQIGAFKSQENAVELCRQNTGYRVFDPAEMEIYPCVDNSEGEFKIRITTSDVRIRKGPGTGFDYHKKNGNPVYTGKGTFTIVKTMDGSGSRHWGLLKAYAANENGWIPLEE